MLFTLGGGGPARRPGWTRFSGAAALLAVAGLVWAQPALAISPREAAEEDCARLQGVPPVPEENQAGPAPFTFLYGVTGGGGEGAPFEVAVSFGEGRARPSAARRSKGVASNTCTRPRANITGAPAASSPG